MKAMLDAKTKTWIAQLKNGVIDKRLILILNHIKQNPGIDTDQLRDQLKIAHQSLTAVITNLLDCGVIEIRSQIQFEDSTYSKYWYVELVDEILNNQKKRLMAKFEQWVKRGMKDFIQFLDEPTILKLELVLVKLNEGPPLIDVHTDEKGQITMFNVT